MHGLDQSSPLACVHYGDWKLVLEAVQYGALPTEPVLYYVRVWNHRWWEMDEMRDWEADFWQEHGIVIPDDADPAAVERIWSEQTQFRRLVEARRLFDRIAHGPPFTE